MLAFCQLKNRLILKWKLLGSHVDYVVDSGHLTESIKIHHFVVSSCSTLVHPSFFPPTPSICLFFLFHIMFFFLFSSFAPSPLILPCSEMTMMSGMETVQMISHYIVLSRVLKKNNIMIPVVYGTVTFTVHLTLDFGCGVVAQEGAA